MNEEIERYANMFRDIDVFIAKIRGWFLSLKGENEQ